HRLQRRLQPAVRAAEAALPLRDRRPAARRGRMARRQSLFRQVGLHVQGTRQHSTKHPHKQSITGPGGRMNNRILKSAMYVAMGLSIAPALPVTFAHAASGDGSLVGKLVDASNKPLAEVEVTARNPETGFSRTVKADTDGNYRFPFLPVGKYEINATKNGAVLGK